MRTEYMVTEWAGEMDCPFSLRRSRCFNAGIERGLHTVVSTIAQLDFNGCSMGQSFKPLAASCFDLGKWLQLMWDLSTGHWLSRERQGWLLSIKKLRKATGLRQRTRQCRELIVGPRALSSHAGGKGPQPVHTGVIHGLHLMDLVSHEVQSMTNNFRPQKMCRPLSGATVYPWP